MRPEQIAVFARARGSEERLQSLEARMRRVWSAGAWLVLEVLRQGASQRYRTASAELAAGIQAASSDLIHVNPWPEAGAREDTFSLITSVWMRASMLMDGMLRAQGVPYLHVIQPNQCERIRALAETTRPVGPLRTRNAAQTPLCAWAVCASFWASNPATKCSAV